MKKTNKPLDALIDNLIDDDLRDAFNTAPELPDGFHLTIQRSDEILIRTTWETEWSIQCDGNELLLYAQKDEEGWLVRSWEKDEWEDMGRVQTPHEAVAMLTALCLLGEYETTFVD
jgi:hypothetical protein